MNKLTKRLFSAGCSLLLLGTAITPAYPVLAETEESAAEAQTEDSAADTEESAAEAQTEVQTDKTIIFGITRD